MFIKVTPQRYVASFGEKKLAHKYIDPFEILQMIGEVAYGVTQFSQFQNIHNVNFHVSILKKYALEPSPVVDWLEI